MSCCYASRCLVDCCIVSWCCPCRWCCDLPQTYEEAYEWQLVPDDMAKMERRYETMTLEQKTVAKATAKEERRRAAAERARLRDANRRWNGVGRMSSRSRSREHHREWQHSNQHQSRDDDDDWDHSVVMGGASTASRSSSARPHGHHHGHGESTCTLRRRQVAGGDAVTATRDLREDNTGTAVDAACTMPRDPILSERSDYESQLSS